MGRDNRPPASPDFQVGSVWVLWLDFGNVLGWEPAGYIQESDLWPPWAGLGMQVLQALAGLPGAEQALVGRCHQVVEV